MDNVLSLQFACPSPLVHSQLTTPPNVCRQLIFAHEQSLRKSLTEELNPAMALHIIVVSLFQHETGAIVHVPGKFVPTMISFLSRYLPRKEHERLVECQHLITVKWKTRQLTSETLPSDGDRAMSGEGSSEDDKIESLIQDLKQLVLSNK